MLSKLLMMASAGVVLLLGVAHLAYTLHGRKLAPRDAAVEQAMAATHLGLTTQTTVWKAWIGFNISHSMGAVLFGLLYAYLAMCQPGLLFRSPYLLAVGGAMLCGLLVLARLYWFNVPLMGISLALGLYAASVMLHRY